MTPETAALAQWATWCGAFWTVVLLTRNQVAGPGDALRLIVALSLGAVFAHLGTALVAPPRVPTGFSVLFVPLGVVVVGLASGTPQDRDRFLRLALPALPLALAVARVGCLLAGCCLGEATSSAWSVASPDGARQIHPVAWLELTLLLGLHGLLLAAPARDGPGLALCGIGLIRLGLEPFRSHVVGEPLLAPSWIALAWVVIGGRLTRWGAPR